MHPFVHAQEWPDKPAVIMGTSGDTRTYGELNARSNQIAHVLRDNGLRPDSTLAVMMENGPALLEVAWAAQRSGLYAVFIPTKLTPREVAYLVSDSNADALIVSNTDAYALELRDLLPQVRRFRVGEGGRDAGYDDLMALAAASPETPIADETSGIDMLYSAGTTGRPKGVRFPRADVPITTSTSVSRRAAGLYGIDSDSVYLSPAPLYHAAPLRYVMAVHKLGATAVVMERFDAEATLQLIEKHRVTHVQFVPTHMVRILRLPSEVRAKYDLSSLRAVIHAAAPCPAWVKEAMIEWLGPIIYEFYGNTEGVGSTSIDSHDWLTHRGSVGKPFECDIRILNDDQQDVPPGTVGNIYLRSTKGLSFEYHGDPQKTADAQGPDGFVTVGDVGMLDEDGFLYIKDRKSDVIISGGVNIYPKEVEDYLSGHSKVADIVVFGIPDDEMGERLAAVIEPIAGMAADDGLRSELNDFARKGLSGVKVPRLIFFSEKLPRTDNGKIKKRFVRDEYVRQLASSADGQSVRRQAAEN